MPVRPTPNTQTISKIPIVTQSDIDDALQRLDSLEPGTEEHRQAFADAKQLMNKYEVPKLRRQAAGLPTDNFDPVKDVYRFTKRMANMAFWKWPKSAALGAKEFGMEIYDLFRVVDASQWYYPGARTFGFEKLFREAMPFVKRDIQAWKDERWAKHKYDLLRNEMRIKKLLGQMTPMDEYRLSQSRKQMQRMIQARRNTMGLERMMNQELLSRWGSTEKLLHALENRPDKILRDIADLSMLEATDLAVILRRSTPDNLPEVLDEARGHIRMLQEQSNLPVPRHEIDAFWPGGADAIETFLETADDATRENVRQLIMESLSVETRNRMGLPRLHQGLGPTERYRRLQDARNNLRSAVGSWNTSEIVEEIFLRDPSLRERNSISLGDARQILDQSQNAYWHYLSEDNTFMGQLVEMFNRRLQEQPGYNYDHIDTSLFLIPDDVMMTDWRFRLDAEGEIHDWTWDELADIDPRLTEQNLRRILNEGGENDINELLTGILNQEPTEVDAVLSAYVGIDASPMRQPLYDFDGHSATYNSDGIQFGSPFISMDESISWDELRQIDPRLTTQEFINNVLNAEGTTEYHEIFHQIDGIMTVGADTPNGQSRIQRLREILNEMEGGTYQGMPTRFEDGVTGNRAVLQDNQLGIIPAAGSTPAILFSPDQLLAIDSRLTPLHLRMILGDELPHAGPLVESLIALSENPSDQLRRQHISNTLDQVDAGEPYNAADAMPQIFSPAAIAQARSEIEAFRADVHGNVETPEFTDSMRRAIVLDILGVDNWADARQFHPGITPEYVAWHGDEDFATFALSLEFGMRPDSMVAIELEHWGIDLHFDGSEDSFGTLPQYAQNVGQTAPTTITGLRTIATDAIAEAIASRGTQTVNDFLRQAGYSETAINDILGFIDEHQINEIAIPSQLTNVPAGEDIPVDPIVGYLQNELSHLNDPEGTSAVPTEAQVANQLENQIVNPETGAAQAPSERQRQGQSDADLSDEDLDELDDFLQELQGIVDDAPEEDN